MLPAVGVGWGGLGDLWGVAQLNGGTTSGLISPPRWVPEQQPHFDKQGTPRWLGGCISARRGAAGPGSHGAGWAARKQQGVFGHHE